MTSGEAHPETRRTMETRRMMKTAIGRLNVLEYLILGVAMGLALLAGVLAAWMAESLMGASFRLSWALSSLLFFVVPGWVVLRRERQAEGFREGVAGTAAPPHSKDINEKRDDGGR